MLSKTNNANILKITQNDVIGIIMRIVEVDGLEAAKAAFKHMNDYFSGIKGWGDTTDAVYTLLAEKRKEENKQLREERLEEQRAGAPKLVVMSKASSFSKSIDADIDEMNVDINSPGNNVAKIIKLRGKDEQ